MSQLRITTMRVRAGEAARRAEEAQDEDGPPQVRRIQAGSAARMAEEAKRAGSTAREGGASFSLRAQGGRVERVGADMAGSLLHHPAARCEEGSGSPAAGETSQTQESAKGPSVNARAGSPEVAERNTVSQAELLPPAASRLKSFLRGLFLPEEPSQPPM